MFQKYSSARGPCQAKCEITAVVTPELQRFQASAAQVLVKTPDRRPLDHIAWRHGGKCSHRQPACKGFQQYETEGVGAAWKNKDISGGVDIGKRLAAPLTDKYCVWKFSLQCAARRAIADHDLAARQVESEEGLEILFHRQSADRQKDRPRQFEIDARARTEQFGVDTAWPQFDVVEATHCKLAGQCWRRRHDCCAGCMKPAQPAPGQLAGPAFRHRQPLGKIVGKPRMEAGGEGQVSPQADATRGVPDRPFGCDMNRIRARHLESLLDVAQTNKRKSNLRIARHRQGPELIRAKEFKFGAECSSLTRHMSKRVNDAVDLRMPGVGGDKNLQAAFALGDDAEASGPVSRLLLVQVMISN